MKERKLKPPKEGLKSTELFQKAMKRGNLADAIQKSIYDNSFDKSQKQGKRPKTSTSK